MQYTFLISCSILIVLFYVYTDIQLHSVLKNQYREWNFLDNSISDLLFFIYSEKRRTQFCYFVKCFGIVTGA